MECHFVGDPSLLITSGHPGGSDTDRVYTLGCEKKKKMKSLVELFFNAVVCLCSFLAIKQKYHN